MQNILNLNTKTMNTRIALFPGSFDPFTTGHESVVRRALPLFNKIVIGIGVNTTKKGFFDVDVRKKIIENSFSDISGIEVVTYTGLTVDFCRHIGADFILRGLRTATDFEYERAVAQMNRLMKHEIETVFLLTESAHSPISSTIVREILKNKGDIRQFVPKRSKIEDFI